jgi:hypothetical protein
MAGVPLRFDQKDVLWVLWCVLPESNRPGAQSFGLPLSVGKLKLVLSKQGRNAGGLPAASNH